MIQNESQVWKKCTQIFLNNTYMLCATSRNMYTPPASLGYGMFKYLRHIQTA